MTDTTVIDGPRSSARETAVETSLKSILLHVQNDSGVHQKLQLGLSLARATGAHLECVQVTPIEAYVMLEAFGILGMDKAMRKIDAQEEQLRSEIETHLRKEDVSWDYQVIAGYAAPELIKRAALSDVLITGRSAHSALVQKPELGMLGDVLTSVRTPILVPGTSEKRFDPFGTAIVAWNGTVEAANAVRSAISLLRLASDVRVIRFTEKKDSFFPDVRLTEYLSRHDVHAELDVRDVRIDFADDIAQYAGLYHGSYIVMGGYSHSRASEIFYGGVTRALLRNCATPLLISH